MTASATVWSRPAPRHVQTQSIHFGPVDELRGQARERVEQLHERGVRAGVLMPRPESDLFRDAFLLSACRSPFRLWAAGCSIRSVAAHDGRLRSFRRGRVGRYRRTARGRVSFEALNARRLQIAASFHHASLAGKRERDRLWEYAGNQGAGVARHHRLDALLNGMATGLFLAAAVSELAAPAVFMRVAKVAYPVAFVLLIVDLGLLVLDLGDPLRFHHMLRVSSPARPCRWGRGL